MTILALQDLLLICLLFEDIELLNLITASRSLKYFIPLVHEVLSVEEEHDDALIVLWIVVAERYLNWKVLSEALLFPLDEDAHVWSHKVDVLVLSAVFVRIDVQLAVVQDYEARLVVPLVGFDEGLPALFDLGVTLIRDRDAEAIEDLGGLAGRLLFGFGTDDRLVADRGTLLLDIGTDDVSAVVPLLFLLVFEECLFSTLPDRQLSLIVLSELSFETVAKL